MKNRSVNKECFDTRGSLGSHGFSRFLDYASEGLGQYLILIICWNVMTLSMVAVVSYVVAPFLATFYSVSDNMVFIMQVVGYLLGILLTAGLMSRLRGMVLDRHDEQVRFRQHGHLHRHA